MPLIVSIHAPWEGCDSYIAMAMCTDTLFQFTHPGKGATLLYRSALGGKRRFNSRTLGRVRLHFTADDLLLRPVSIHAPWEGCDVPR